MKPRRKYKHHPYREWEIEFIGCDKTINEFGASKGLDNNTVGSFYRYAKAQKWEERRQEFFDKARERFLAKAPEVVADKWVEYRGSVSNLHKQLQRVIQKLSEEESPEVIAKLAKSAAETVDVLIKSDSFMAGGPTDRTESRSINLHATISEALKARDKKFGIPE